MYLVINYKGWDHNMKKILQVTTISNTINAFLIPHINVLINKGYQVDIACNEVVEIDQFKFSKTVVQHQIEFQRSPKSVKNIKAYKELKNLVLSNNYDVIHTHTPVASVLVRLLKKRKKLDAKIIYTSHGFQFYKGGRKRDWLVYYNIEKWLSRYTDVLVTINEEDYQLAKSKMYSTKIIKIPGIGLDLDRFTQIAEVDKLYVKTLLNLPKDSIIITSVGELNKNKNHDVIVRALSILKNKKIHYVICGDGPLKEKYQRNKLENVHILGFRKDIPSILCGTDIFAFPSLREGLGMAALEAMAVGLPLVTSDIHGINDYMDNGKTGYVCNSRSSEQFSVAINKILDNPETMYRISEHNKKSVSYYSVENSVKSTLEIYNELFNTVIK